jgi:virginiamycin B lyase
MRHSTRRTRDRKHPLSYTLNRLLVLGVVGASVLWPEGVWAGPVREFAVPTAASAPRAIAPGPDGALWFTEALGNRIGRIATSGEISEFALPQADSFPSGITTGPDGALWFTKWGGIGRITTDGELREFPVIPLSGHAPQPAEDITTGPDGALWFTEIGRIGRITTSGEVAGFPYRGRFAFSVGITVGPDQALWFAKFPDKIVRITTAGEMTEFALPPARKTVRGIAAGPDGALWYTRDLADTVGRITTSGSVREFPLSSAESWPAAIAAGPDGALWFTESRGNRIGRITTSGHIAEFRLRANSGPRDIVAAPDGALWFTETAGNRIGRIAPGAVMFGAKTLVTLMLAKKRIPFGGPLAVRVTNANGFRVTGKLAGLATARRIKVKPKALTVSAGARKTVKLKLPTALNHLLKRHGELSVRLRARVRDPVGTARTVKKKVSLKIFPLRIESVERHSCAWCRAYDRTLTEDH